MDKEIRNLLKRLEHDGVAFVNNGQLVRNFSSTAKIRKLRETEQLYIAKDRRKNVTVVINKKFFNIL